MARRWLGQSHAIKVKKNPLHYSTKIEDLVACIRCCQAKHYSSFMVGGFETSVCQECREVLAVKHRVTDGC